jgi:hypothetical protein
MALSRTRADGKGGGSQLEHRWPRGTGGLRTGEACRLEVQGRPAQDCYPQLVSQSLLSSAWESVCPWRPSQALMASSAHCPCC